MNQDKIERDAKIAHRLAVESIYKASNSKFAWLRPKTKSEIKFLDFSNIKTYDEYLRARKEFYKIDNQYFITLFKRVGRIENDEQYDLNLDYDE